jgi:hypothetical protein
MSLDGYVQWLERLAAADTEDAMWATFGEAQPPRDPLTWMQLRNRLINVLKEKRVSAPARVADSWRGVYVRRGAPDEPDNRKTHQNANGDGRFRVHTPHRTAPDEPPDLASEADILAALLRDLAASGLAGEQDGARLVYLQLTSRLLPWGKPTNRPVSGLPKGASSTGKSFLTDVVLKLFPSSAYFLLTAASKRYLIYTDESLEHRFVVVAEWASIANDEDLVAALRTLLSEGRLRYGSVSTEGGAPMAFEIDKAGPTGLLMTTTRAQIDEELETRLISFVTDDSPEQTRKVFEALAGLEDDDELPIDVGRWHDLQEWLAQHGEHRVHIPYIGRLAKLMPTDAPRLRRDFVSLLCLVRAHALLHQVTRERDDRGRIVATIDDDYTVVRGLLDGLISQAVDAAVSPQMRATVEAVRVLTEELAVEYVSVKRITDKLGVGRSATYARIRRALASGFLVNLAAEGERGLKIAIGAELPTERTFLPLSDDLRCPVSFTGAPDDKNPGATGDCEGLSGCPVRPAGVRREYIGADGDDDLFEEIADACGTCSCPAPSPAGRVCMECGGAVR